jgi:hypothetical protein
MVTKGDYVIATKFCDGDPDDQWCVGFYDHSEDIGVTTRYFVVDSKDKQTRANGYRKIKVISRATGEWILEHPDELGDCVCGK